MSKPFELPPEMTIYSAVETRDALLAWVTEEVAKSSKLLQVSAAQVSEIDGSGLQLLAALSNMEHSWHLVQSSEAFTEACRTMGFGHWLDPRRMVSNRETQP